MAETNKTKKSKTYIALEKLPTLIATILFIAFWGISILLFAGRKSEAVRFDFLLDWMPDFYSHISNFTLCFMFYVVIGILWLMQNLSFRYIIYLGLFMLALNFIYELFIPILNTPDIIDAYFGAVGTIVAFLFLGYVNYFGLQPNPNWKGADKAVD